ncbi:MAG: pyridoxal-phosphate dependent enzyme [Gammaproteobacteria bacterium]|nr:pyridoxal-phosphate dependent enzyme [Gammaproteobacteria bacterium]NNF49549.1 pyridoxal-phosphate dependent enzyme [Woeseiaceae bacterium]MBT8093843.1 pyridoxal-phosphate dependent enzyme [Gammaproteobacteria bacterium]MBT8105814.1 pyridoxal-phosphate dependent enzyme [Gammaproteobacteria bacterium]NNK25828.1 pyridoxal-phosphate dependent enzyme [Woeseiaceae bacterium]
MRDFLADAFPAIGRRIPKDAIADLPTPVSTRRVSLQSGSFDIGIKHDEATHALCGGNKVRKLEYLLRRARDRGARRVATFGAAGSNHALATAIHARAAGFECTCFLSHQHRTGKVARTLNMHRELGTEIFLWGDQIDQLALFRRHLQRRNVWVIPLGGSCWLGALGFVNAGLELAWQVEHELVTRPSRIYVASGTSGTAAGLALGLAAAGLDTEVHAVKVVDTRFGNERKLRKLAAKTHELLNRIEPRFIAAGWQDRIVWRDEFLAGGYARVDDRTQKAVELAEQQLGLALETTYTGKAMAALLHDLPSHPGDVMFWCTYGAQRLPVTAEKPDELQNIPGEFERYYA